jgi:hypothetical protein
MKIVRLQNNVTNAPQVEVTVTNKFYKKLLELTTAGGFLRFHIDLYDEPSGRMSPSKLKEEAIKLVDFLYTVFVNKPLINSYFNIK